MSDLVKIFSAGPMGLAIVLFLFPFVNFSCGGTKVIEFSGLQLVTGTTVEIMDKEEKLPPAPSVGLALLAACCGMVVALSRWPKRNGILIGLAAAGVLALLWFKSSLDKEVLRETQGMVAAEYQIGYWGSILMFVITVGANIFGLTEQKPRGGEAGLPENLPHRASLPNQPLEYPYQRSNPGRED